MDDAATNRLIVGRLQGPGAVNEWQAYKNEYTRQNDSVDQIITHLKASGLYKRQVIHYGDKLPILEQLNYPSAEEEQNYTIYKHCRNESLLEEI